MKPKKQNILKNGEEMNMWQPTADMMSALVYILMLVVLLMGLYLMHIPEHTELDPNPGEGLIDGWQEDGGASPSPTVTWNSDWDHDGGGGHTPHPTPEPSATPTVTPTVTPTFRPQDGFGGGGGGGNGGGEGPGDDPDNGFKSAVYVMLVDGETQRTVKEANVQFELYMADGSLQILNSYYPERISYRNYVTTESGTFYLPEKLMGGEYELHELTEPVFYDAAPNQRFVLEDMYDWPDPYVVRVPVYPSRNVIRVQMTDDETGLPVSGGTFDVISVYDVITPDGTLRYRAGEIVSSIICDETGYGVSDEIYLGLYKVQQRDIPAWYVAMEESWEAGVEKKGDIEPPVHAASCQRTKIHIFLGDELYPAKGISDVAFTVRSDKAGAEPVEVKTDGLGRITLDELDKGVTYRIQQSGTNGHYKADQDIHTVKVGLDGRIGGENETELNLTNRMLRVSIGVTDEFSKVQVPGVSLALYNAEDELLHSWTTTGTSLMMEELQEGSYYVIKDGDMENRYPVRVRNQAGIQEINIHTTYVMQYVLLGVAALALIGAGLLVPGMIRRKKNKSK